MTRSQIPARATRGSTSPGPQAESVVTPARVLRAGAWAIAAAYVVCWAAGLIPWWLVLGYALVLTIALAEAPDQC